jgi:hypothetical protein
VVVVSRDAALLNQSGASKASISGSRLFRMTRPMARWEEGR